MRSSKWQPKIILGLIFLLAFGFRIVGLNWDQDQHLHPDERFLTMVGVAMTWPESLATYFDPAISQLNPHNIGYGFFVYGHWPLTLNKLLAITFDHDNYQLFTLQGRFLSAVADALIVIVIFQLGQFLTKKYRLPTDLSWWATIFYALAAQPIQQAHFFTVDSFANFFGWLSVCWSWKYQFRPQRSTFIASALALAAGLASKINCLIFLPLNAWFILDLSTALQPLINQSAKTGSKFRQLIWPLIKASFWKISFYLLIVYFALRCFDPYLFADHNWLNWQLNPQFIDNINSLQNLASPDAWYPPSVQWLKTQPIIFPLQNISRYGLGPVLTLAIIWGGSLLSLIAGRQFLNWLKQKISHPQQTKINWTLLLNSSDWAILIGWSLAFFGYQSFQFVKGLRYFLFLIPAISLLAGYGLSHLMHFWQQRQILFLGTIGTLIGLLIWPLALMSIYLRPHPRLVASAWLTDQLPVGSVIAAEYWDDALPISHDPTKIKIIQLPVFDPDTPEKWARMNQLLAQVDYYVLSSDRAWRPIMANPEHYPQMSEFYRQLFAGQTQFKKIAEFTSYPSLGYLNIPLTFNDRQAEESWTVYDHPQVMIFKKIGAPTIDN